MKTLSKLAVGTLVALGIAASTAVLAHGYGPMFSQGPHGFGPMGQCQYGGPGAGLDSLKTELKLTAKQEAAWKTFENAVRNQIASHGYGPGHPMTGGADAMQAHIAFMQQRLAGMQTIQKARTDLYQILTPEQKTVLDRYGPHFPRG